MKEKKENEVCVHCYFRDFSEEGVKRLISVPDLQQNVKVQIYSYMCTKHIFPQGKIIFHIFELK